MSDQKTEAAAGSGYAGPVGSVPANDLGIFAAHSRQGLVDHASLAKIIDGPIRSVQPAYAADRATTQVVDSDAPNTTVQRRETAEEKT